MGEKVKIQDEQALIEATMNQVKAYVAQPEPQFDEAAWSFKKFERMFMNHYAANMPVQQGDFRLFLGFVSGMMKQMRGNANYHDLGMTDDEVTDVINRMPPVVKKYFDTEIFVIRRTDGTAREYGLLHGEGEYGSGAQQVTMADLVDLSGGQSLAFDSVMSDTSENGVKNRVIKEYVDTVSRQQRARIRVLETSYAMNEANEKAIENDLSPQLFALMQEIRQGNTPELLILKNGDDFYPCIYTSRVTESADDFSWISLHVSEINMDNNNNNKFLISTSVFASANKGEMVEVQFKHHTCDVLAVTDVSDIPDKNPDADKWRKLPLSAYAGWLLNQNKVTKSHNKDLMPLAQAPDNTAEHFLNALGEYKKVSTNDFTGVAAELVAAHNQNDSAHQDIRNSIDNMAGGAVVVQKSEFAEKLGNQASSYTKAQLDALLNKLVKDMLLNETNYVLTVQYQDGTAKEIDFPIEATVKDGRFDTDANELVLVLVSNQEIRIPAAGLVKVYEGKETTTTTTVVGSDGKIGVDVNQGAIKKTHLHDELVAEIEGHQTIAGDTKDNITTFTEAPERINIASGDKQSVLFGKIMKWFSSLKALAFKDKADWDTDIDNRPAIPDSAHLIVDNKQTQTITGVELNINANETGESKIGFLREDAPVGFVGLSNVFDESGNKDDLCLFNSMHGNKLIIGRDGKNYSVRPGVAKKEIATVDQIPDTSGKVDKVTGKQLSTEDISIVITPTLASSYPDGTIVIKTA